MLSHWFCCSWSYQNIEAWCINSTYHEVFEHQIWFPFRKGLVHYNIFWNDKLLVPKSLPRHLKKFSLKYNGVGAKYTWDMNVWRNIPPFSGKEVAFSLVCKSSINVYSWTFGETAHSIVIVICQTNSWYYISYLCSNMCISICQYL